MWMLHSSKIKKNRSCINPHKSRHTHRSFTALSFFGSFNLSCSHHGCIITNGWYKKSHHIGSYMFEIKSVTMHNHRPTRSLTAAVFFIFFSPTFLVYMLCSSTSKAVDECDDKERPRERNITNEAAIKRFSCHFFFLNIEYVPFFGIG